MKNFVSLVAARFVEILVVKLFYDGVFVRLAELALRIRTVNRLRTEFLDVETGVDLVGSNDGLSAAVYATAGASHNLDELVLALARFDLFEKLASVCKSVCDRYFNRSAVHIDFGSFDAFSSANRLIIDGRRLFAGNDFVHCAECGFHNAAGCTEDKSRARTDAERSVEFFVRKYIVFDTETLDKTSCFAGGKNDVNVGITACVLVRALDFGLFRGARHNGNNINILGVYTVLFRVIGLDRRAHHLLRRLACREVSEKLRIVEFDETNPAWGAARDHGKGCVLVAEALKKLGALFHNGKVRRHIDVEHLVETDSAERCYHFALRVRAYGETEFFAESDADRGSGDRDNVLGLIAERRNYLVGIVLLGERAYGADVDTLSASNAIDVGERSSERATDRGVETALVCADNADGLILVTSRYATTAKNALPVIADKVIVFEFGSGRGFNARELSFVAAVFVGKLLELAISAAHARKAFLFVVGKKKFERGFARFDNLRGFGINFHTLGNDRRAARYKASRALYFDYANAAAAFVGKILIVAKRGDTESCFARGVEDTRSFGNGNAYVVYF